MGYRIGVDIGGTFTDCVVVDAAGRRSVAKSLSTHGSLADGVLSAVAVNAESLGLTRAELLRDTRPLRPRHDGRDERRADPQRRPYRPHHHPGARGRDHHRQGLREARGPARARHRALLAAGEAGADHSPRADHGVAERVDVDGDVVVQLDEDEAIRGRSTRCVAAGVEAIAVCFLWSFVNDAHERRVAGAAAPSARPASSSRSRSELAPVLGEYERTATTAVNAYVAPKVVGLPRATSSGGCARRGCAEPLLVMQASGGADLASRTPRAGRSSPLDSGPTGGILGCQYLGRLYGEHERRSAPTSAGRPSTSG